MATVYFEQIDWNEAWKQAFDIDCAHTEGEEYWDGDSERFNLRPLMDDYTRKALAVLEVAGSYSLLDIGCGVGNLAIPLAKKVRTVTALDISSKMLDYLQQKARQAGVGNINCMHKDWLQVKVGEDLLPHDVVISSCSMITSNPREAILKMDQAARNRVYIIWGAPNPYFKKVYQAMGREAKGYPSYIYLYNLLYQMGIYAHIDIVESVRQFVYPSLDKLMELWRHRMGGLSDREESKLITYFKRELIEDNGSLRHRHEISARWAFMWWEK